MLLGRVEPIGSPDRWYRCESWESSEIVIVVYSDEADGLVIRRDSMPGRSYPFKNQLARLFRPFLGR